MSEGRWRTVRVATYNIHRCRGMDGRTRPDRTAAVLASLDADILALQEVIGARPAGGGHAELLGAALGMGWVMASARQLRGALFGNVVLSRFPVRHHAQYRPVLEDVRAALLPARRSGSRRRTAAPLQRPPRHRVPGTPLPGAAPRGHRERSPRAGREGGARRLQRVDARAGHDAPVGTAAGHRPEHAPAAPAHVSGLVPDSATSITSTTRATSKSPESSCPARARRSWHRTTCRWWRS